MRGKKPRERGSYVIRMGDGTLVEVSREVYLEWYQSRRRERYQQERNQKQGIYSFHEWEEKGGCPDMPFCVRDSLEETVLRNLCRNKIREALKDLAVPDARLIELLYFKEVTVTEAAEICGCSRKTIQNRRKQILEELRQTMQKQGIKGGYF